MKGPGKTAAAALSQVARRTAGAIGRVRGTALALVVLAAPAAAQVPPVARLDSATAAFIAAAVAEAEAAGLPGDPLRNKALEGASKGADGEVIRAAVGRLATRLRTAARALDPRPTEAELVAGAALLDLGVPAEALATLRLARPDDSIASALVGLAFLVQRGGVPEASTEIVRAMLTASADDGDFVRFQRLVEQDLRAGAPIGGAAQARARAFIEHGGRIRPRPPDGGS